VRLPDIQELKELERETGLDVQLGKSRMDVSTTT
jgi:hypothetical protein